MNRKVTYSHGLFFSLFCLFLSIPVAWGNSLVVTYQPPSDSSRQEEELEEVMVSSGTIDVAIERETPVAVSTITGPEIESKLGNLEFAEILKTTPSIYVTKQGGGFGDSRINVRGFNQRNTAILINGQPVNDMENGWVYWSNWAGLQDIASSVQVQRGLGASKLAVPSVGGTINIVTKATAKKQGGFAKFQVGNDNYLKGTLGYNTGMNSKGWAFSFLMSYWSGDGYVDGTKGEGISYFASLGYKPSENHTFNIMYTGAAQWHHQRSAALTIEDITNFGRKYNADWGYLNGREYTFRRNFYTKPIGSINWDWDINDKWSLATVAYGSWGRGGGTGPRGGNYEIYPYRSSVTKNVLNPAGNKLDHRDAQTGLIQFDEIAQKNRAVTPYAGSSSFYQGTLVGANNSKNAEGIGTKVAIRRSSINSHDWYGVISNLRFQPNDKWTIGAGVDWRSYEGYHYRVVNDLLGLDAYYSTGNENSLGKFVTTTSEATFFSDITSSDKIDYYNIGKVGWLAGNLFVEYKTDKISAVLQGGFSNQNYQRIDYFNEQTEFASKKRDITGGYIKGGLNWNISEKHNVFFNTGYIARQPLFDAVFPNFSNNVNPDVTPEKIFTVELGYGFVATNFKANVNLYRTTWTNRWLTRGVQISNSAGGTEDGTATFSGIEQEHLGVELDLSWSALQNQLLIKGMLSIGDWKYTSSSTANVFNDNQQLIGSSTQYLGSVKVGDAAQFTASLFASYKIFKGFSVDVTAHFADELYANLDPLSTEFSKKKNEGAVRLPGYTLFDAGLSYKLPFSSDKRSLTLRFNMNNVFDEFYYSESRTNTHMPNTGGVAERGVNVQNQVWVGFGRTWNVSLRFNF